MRPVNLIPLEERRGENRPMRTGPVPYLLVGALLAVLAGVTALVLTGNQIADRKSEVAKLEREDAVASARAKRLSAYTQFRTLREQRVQTVTSLADSRFDWERVMRELSLVLPRDVWLVSLDASAAPGAEGGGSSSGSGGSGLSSSIAGPSLTISGCATGHDAVAGFVTALKEIDGVTRVGVESSELPSQQEGAGKSGGSSGGGGSGGGGESTDCRTRAFIASFKMVVAFDAAPVPQIASSGEAPAPAAAQAQTASSETSKSGEASAGGETSKSPAGGG
jgi:Tfp pilus assembly protein PilN